MNLLGGSMKRSSALFLKAIIVFVGIGALAFMLGEPQVEGVNAGATFPQVYFDDPFLAFAYVASIPFFVALYQAFKLLGFAGQRKIHAKQAIKAVRTIKYCALACIGFVVIGEILIMSMPSDDRAGGVFMGLLIALGSIMAAAAAMVIERNLKKGGTAKPGTL